MNRIHVFLFNVLLVALCHVKFILFFEYFFGQWYLEISNNVSYKNVLCYSFHPQRICMKINNHALLVSRRILQREDLMGVSDTVSEFQFLHRFIFLC